VKYLLLLLDLSETGFSSYIFEKYSNIRFFSKILPVGTEIFQTNRRVDMAKLIVAFRKFGNAPKKGESESMVRNNDIGS